MNLYKVTLGKATGAIHASNYVVAAISEHEAVYGEQTRKSLHEIFTDWSKWNDASPTNGEVMSEVHYYELPLTVEESNIYRCGERTFEVTLVATQLELPYENGHVLCCDYRNC